MLQNPFKILAKTHFLSRLNEMKQKFLRLKNYASIKINQNSSIITEKKEFFVSQHCFFAQILGIQKSTKP